jgi:hypothetical protein
MCAGKPQRKLGLLLCTLSVSVSAENTIRKDGFYENRPKVGPGAD